MARKYAVTGTDTNTAATTQAGITSTAAIQPKLYDIVIGSVATPADNACEYFIQRSTAAGTSTAFTPVSLDPTDAAATATSGVNHTVEPTYTASSIPLRFAANQRATFRWVAAPGSEIKMPSTAANGLGVLANAVGGSAYTNAFTLLYEE